MKAKDLQIGDLVKITEPDDFHGYIGEVRIINDITGYITIAIPFMHTTDVLCDDLEPIPLTKEILKKNGWKRENDKKAYMVNYDFEQNDMNCWCMWCIKERNLEVQTQSSDLSKYNLCVRRVVIPCDYVHELQHALRMCDIGKEIVL